MKKGLTGAILATALLGLTAPALQAATPTDAYKIKVGLNLRSYFGLVSSGVEGESGYFNEVNEGNLSATITSGAVKGYMEIETREGKVTPTTMRNIVYSMPSGLSLGLGTFKQKSSVNFAATAGSGTAATGKANFYVGLTNKLEGEGLKLGYQAGAHHVAVTMYEDDRINATDGSTTQIGARGKIGPIAYRVTNTSAVSDDHKGGTTVASSGSNVGLKFDGGGFSISVDSASKVKGTGAVAASAATDDAAAVTAVDAFDTTYTDTALQAGVKLGDNKLIITVAAETNKTSVTDAKANLTNHTDVVFSIPVAKNAALKVAYAAKSTSVEDSTDAATTATFAGLGLAVKF